MFVLSVSSVQRMGSQPKSLVKFSYVFEIFMFSCKQGELAHKIVKCLYGLTNKRNAEQQIAKRYQRLERARLALDRKRLHSHTKQKTTIQDGNQPDGDSELRYYISPSKNHPQDILSTLHNNRGDPAYHVLSFSDINAFVIITHADGMFSRNFYRSFKIICSDD